MRPRIRNQQNMLVRRLPLPRWIWGSRVDVQELEGGRKTLCEGVLGVASPVELDVLQQAENRGMGGA
jgi:hypothetical protein